MKIADKDEQRKAFALDCVIRLEEGRGIYYTVMKEMN